MKAIGRYMDAKGSDPQMFSDASKNMGMVGHSETLGDYRNADVLCGSCHNHDDRTSNTGWVFLPARMDWIIQWEEKDYKERLEILETTGRVAERIYPNEEDYERSMRETGLRMDPDDG
ncbi:hypothetical protein LTR17_026436 [Elasticomyces elasticus]|nr:hypothetical protein LTR17_026436 [Elasticomyces elasticus]